MRLVTFDAGEGPRPGAVAGNDVYDLGARGGWPSVRALLAADAIVTAARLCRGAPDHHRAEVRIGLPVPDPERILCVGVNYRDRNAEYRDGSEAPRFPSLFVRFPGSLAADGEDLWIPPESVELDYEGEIVLVIGRPGRRIPEAAAMDHVAGLSVMNEGTIRDWVRHGKFNVTPGKNWPRSGAFGPWIETDLAPLDLGDLRVETRVNGELRQSDTTANMAFPFARILAYVSTFTPLAPGDVIATGTPAGAGARLDPPRWLVPGDRVEVTVPGVGTLANRVAREPV